MTLKEKMFEYLRENPKAPHKEIVENTGIPGERVGIGKEITKLLEKL